MMRSISLSSVESMAEARAEIIFAPWSCWDQGVGLDRKLNTGVEVAEVVLGYHCALQQERDCLCWITHQVTVAREGALKRLPLFRGACSARDHLERLVTGRVEGERLCGAVAGSLTV